MDEQKKMLDDATVDAIIKDIMDQCPGQIADDGYEFDNPPFTDPDAIEVEIK